MNKGAVPQGTKNEEAINRSGWKGTFNPIVEDSNYLGKRQGWRATKKLKR